jgi:hypothetical protein
VRRSACSALAGALIAMMATACAPSIRPDVPDSGAAGADSDGGAPPGKVEVEDNGDGSATVTVNATDPESWVYLDLAEVALVEPADPGASADWDLGLQRFHFALDGGVSGAGQGALVVVDGAELTDVSDVPTEGWVTDAPDDADEDTLPEWAFETAEGGWYDYDDATHVLTPKPRVYVVRGADGDPFALRIDAYYNSAGSPAWPTFTVKPLAATPATPGGASAIHSGARRFHAPPRHPAPSLSPRL